MVGAGKVTEGLAAYERALALQPRYGEALYNLGVAYTELGQLDRALFMSVGGGGVAVKGGGAEGGGWGVGGGLCRG